MRRSTPSNGRPSEPGGGVVLGQHSRDAADLGLPVAVADAQAVLRAVALQHVRAERLARRHQLAHAAQIGAVER